MILTDEGQIHFLKHLYQKGKFNFLFKTSTNGPICICENKPRFDKNDNCLEYYGLYKVLDSYQEDLAKEILGDKYFMIDIRKKLGIIDWANIPVDTPIRVWNNASKTKERRHFAGYENGYVLTWAHGGTSWSSPKHCVSEWDHAELVEL
ncbi:hypothetical protein [Veillonella parvula]